MVRRFFILVGWGIGMGMDLGRFLGTCGPQNLYPNIYPGIKHRAHKAKYAGSGAPAG
jgi:hypothetical protein